MDNREELEQIKQELTSTKSELSNALNSLRELQQSVDQFKQEYHTHQHDDADGTVRLNTTAQKIANVGELVAYGNGGVVQLDVPDRVTGKDQQNMIMIAGKDLSVEAVDSTAGKGLESAVLAFANIPRPTGGEQGESLLAGYAKPQYVNFGKSVTSGGSTLVDDYFEWKTNELAGALINIYDEDANHIVTRQIASNTDDTITIDGTFPSSVSNCQYETFVPSVLGAPNIRWKQLFLSGTEVATYAQRLAIGMGFAGGGAIGIYFGTGSPESVVAANPGSIFLRTDGSTTTTLYVKTSGTENTGWTAK